ncbi:hypothetical protein MM239_14930 [Belliella sp. DSM 111904]|uniref:Lipocalin-like domain-containing protein n=1 Tax=Belliella filtrata TaxID=2923435 RepID=A0ABS9V3C7_9BACT|nr:hypothetical protein [Belliella filtrata]MCH7410700.1 hypothetical protein [Belliella filtrata]
MVNNLFFLSILLAIGNCKPKDKANLSKELLIGSWASCLEDGLYVELHFTEEGDYAYHLDAEVLDYNFGKYAVCSDKIHVSEQEEDLDCEQELVNRMEIVFKSKKSLKVLRTERSIFLEKCQTNLLWTINRALNFLKKKDT